MNKRTIIGLAVLTAVALGSGSATPTNLDLNSNTFIVENNEEGKINLCSNNYDYKPTISAKRGNKTYYYLDGTQLVSMLVNNDSICNYDYVPTVIYGGMCSSANRKTQFRKAIEYMNGEGLEITRDDFFPSNFNDNNVYTVVFLLDGQNNGDDHDGNEDDCNNLIRINYKFKTINGVRKLDYMNVWASNLGGDLVSSYNGDSVSNCNWNLIWEVNSSNLNSTSDKGDYDGTITVDGIEYGYFYDSFDREFDPCNHDGEPTLYYTGIDSISIGMIKDNKYTNVTTYSKMNNNLDRMGTDEDLFKGIANNTFYLGQTNYPSDNNFPTITGPTYIVNVDNPLTLAQIKAQLKATDPTEGDITDRIEIINCIYVLVNGKIDKGIYSFTAKVSDTAGNETTKDFTILVRDAVAPIITAKTKTTGNSTYLTQDELKALFTYSDDVTATQSLKLTITLDGYTANYRKPGKYNVVVSVTDLAGNVGTATAVITVTDTTKPTISATNKNQSYTTKLSQDQLKALFTISDDVSQKSNLKLEIITDNYSSKFSSLGQYTVIAKVTDEAGNFSQATATITVIDDVKPVISFNSKIEIDNLSKRSIDDIKKFVSVTDAKSQIKEYTLTDTDDYANNYNKPGEYHFEVVAVDSANNKATATLTITVLDKDVPVISWKSDYIILVEEGDPLTAEKILNILISSGQLEQGQATDVQSNYFNNETVPGEYDLSVSTLSGAFVKAKIRVLQAEKKADIDTSSKDDSNKDNSSTDDKNDSSFFEQYKYIIYGLASLTIVGLIVLLALKRKKK